MQYEEMTNASGLQGVNVSYLAVVCGVKTTSRKHLLLFFYSTIMASALSFKQSQYIYQ